MATTDILYRYFKARQEVNENGHAETLAQCIHYNRGVDAVVLDMKDKELAQNILKETDVNDAFDSWLLDIAGNLVLVYPREQREKYMEIQPHLVLGEKLVQYGGFSHSEAQAMKDFLKEAGVDYKQTVGDGGRIGFLFAENKEYIFKNAMETIKREETTDVGEKHFISQNLYWRYAINQASKALNYDGVVFVGSEAGTRGIRIDKNGAISMNPLKKGRFIPKNDPNYERKVLNEILNTTNGKEFPVKIFYGELADMMSQDMTRKSLRESPLMLKKREALDILALASIPSVDEIGKMVNHIEDYGDSERKAIYSLMRMRVCRDCKIEDIQTYKMSKQDKQDYKQMHEQHIKQFAKGCRQNREGLADER